MKVAKVSTSHIQAVTGTTFVATLSSLLFGYATAVIAGVVGAIDHNFIVPRGLGETASSWLLGLAVCSALVGTIIGALIARPMAEWLGRKKPMILAAVFFVVSASGSAFPEIGFAPVGQLGPDALWPFIVYRIIGGVAIGIASLIAPMYVSEFAPSAVRGQLGAYQQIAIIGGMTLAYVVNWGIGLQGDDNWMLETGWRWVMLAMAVPAIAFFLLSFTVPESPRWLVQTGRIEQAHRALLRSADPEEARAMLADLAEDTEAAEKPEPVRAFGTRVIIVGVALSVFQQLVGINAICYYGPEIFRHMGYHMDAAFLGIAVASMVNMLFTMVVVLIVDKVGRKPLLILGGIVMGISMLSLGSLFHAQVTGMLGLLAICGFFAGFAISFGPIVWIMLSEIFPGPIRGQAMSIAVSAQWVANLLVSASVPWMLRDGFLNSFSNHGFAFWIYGSCALLAAFVVLRYVPETKGVDNDLLGAFWRRQAGIATAGKA